MGWDGGVGEKLETWKSENLTDLMTRRHRHPWESLEAHGEATGRRVRRVKWCFVDFYG